MDVSFILPGGEDKEITFTDLVRIAAAYDMGWITRGTGKTYDSLTGSAALVGKLTNKVLSYTSKNRKCRQCDRGSPQNEHDCRRNFKGSAKAMEPAAAVDLAVNNSIFQELNIQLGVMIGDNDSSAISAVRSASSHQIVKLADKNYTLVGVVNAL